MSQRPNHPIIDELADLDRTVSLSSRDIESLTATIGTSDFVPMLLDFLHKLVAADFISVFCIGADDDPILVGTESFISQHRADLAAQGYQANYLQDVDFQLMQSGTKEGDYSTYQNRDDISSIAYQRDCYDRPGIADRRSAIRKKSDYALKVSVYRSVEQGEFDEQDRKILDAILPLILTQTEQHLLFEWKLKNAAHATRDVQMSICFPALTRREREVLSLTIDGCTAREIAEELGIAETTVITHRNNGYKRIGVKNLRELMKLGIFSHST